MGNFVRPLSYLLFIVLWSRLQVYVRSESQNDISTRSNELTPLEEDSNDSEFQMVRKKQRRRRGVEQGSKRTRRRRSGTTGAQRSPRRKSASSVPPSEPPSDHSADSDLDSVHSLPATGRPVSRPLSRPASESVCDIPLPTPAAPLTTPSTLTTHDFPSLPVKPEARLEMKPEPKHETRLPELKAESRYPDSKSEPRHIEVKPEPRHTEVRPEPKYQEVMTESRYQEVKPESRYQEVKPELRYQEVKPESRQQEVKPESRSQEQEVKPEPRHQEVKPELRHQDVGPKVEPQCPENRQEPKVEAKPKTRSKSEGPNTRPPVILLDGRRSQDAAACEITFGFEVNMQLLSLNDTSTPDAQDVPPRKTSGTDAKASDAVATETTEPVVVSAVTAPMPQKPVMPTVTATYPNASPNAMPVLSSTEAPRKPDVRPHTTWKTSESSSSARPPPHSSASILTPVYHLAPAYPSPPPTMATKFAWREEPPSQHPMRTYGSNQRPVPIPTPKPQPKPSVPMDTFAKPVRPSTLHFPQQPQPLNRDTRFVHSGEKISKRFNTYIVTNHMSKKAHEARILPVRPVNDPTSGMYMFAHSS